MKQIVAALQIGSSPLGMRATLDKLLSYESQIVEAGCSLVVIPEATLGGYPKGSTFDTYVGYRSQTGREEFSRYFQEAIEVPGSETDILLELAKRTGSSFVLGAIERGGSTLYCTMVYIDSEKGYIGKHRKLMPTASERLIWGQGDGSGLITMENERLGKIGGGICWENYMPLYRATMYAKGVTIYCAPTVDEREIWQSLMRTIGAEGRLYVISAVQFLPNPQECNLKLPSWEEDRNCINGGSVIVDPYGNILAGPLVGKEGLLSCEIDTETIVESRYDLDINGHYARNDIFQLTVDERARRGVSFLGSNK
ncbi:uncharacterized protein PRCAT00003476001 [Priceomyces carsonii]|uniref:uncharacterized protein n=1 Tax=Priceomyces carsonii TaxID=28549 RepID=UPI002EDBAEB7|nr:unnamed protein product [Priceomyces carsonii]